MVTDERNPKTEMNEASMGRTTTGPLSGRASHGDPVPGGLGGSGGSAHFDLPGDLPVRVHSVSAGGQAQAGGIQSVRPSGHDVHGSQITTELQRSGRRRRSGGPRMTRLKNVAARWPRTTIWAHACIGLALVVQFLSMGHVL